MIANISGFELEKSENALLDTIMVAGNLTQRANTHCMHFTKDEVLGPANCQKTSRIVMPGWQLLNRVRNNNEKGT